MKHNTNIKLIEVSNEAVNQSNYNGAVSGLFKISRAWGCIKSFDELIADAKFIFSHNGHKGRRPRIVLNTPIEGCDCIEIDYDCYGLITNGVTKFDANWGKGITDSSKDCIGFIKDFIITEGAENGIFNEAHQPPIV